jgi:hypothetical protein
MTFSWLFKETGQTDVDITSTEVVSGGYRSVTVTVPSRCGSNHENAVILTVSNSKNAACVVAKCVWWMVPCATCPDLIDFCSGKAGATEVAVFNTVPA